MLEFIQQLKLRYQVVMDASLNNGNDLNEYQVYIDQLTLAEDFVRKGILIADKPKHPLQIAIIGPTQAGKSTLVDLITDHKVAGISPLAGYTIHPQGFACESDQPSWEWLDKFFADFQRYPQQDLPREDTNCFSLTLVSSDVNQSLTNSVVWDTPDFDSIGAVSYREGVFKTIALADIVVLVISKEKYADSSVWHIMSLIESLGQPTLICVNKLPEENSSVVLNSLKQKWQNARTDKVPQIVSFPYQKGGVQKTLLTDQLEQIYRVLLDGKQRSIRKKHNAFARQFITQHRQKWIQPVLLEHELEKTWIQLIDDALRNGIRRYRRDYLDHPQHYETFQNAIAELLTLLEIPGLAAALSGIRKVITWPVKQIFRLGQKGGKKEHLAESSNEVAVLNQMGEYIQMQLLEAVLDKIEEEPEKLWWREVSNMLRSEKDTVQAEFESAVKVYHADFQDEIEEVAQSLYNKLQESPTTLNALRATRVTTDAAAVAVALHTGGIGLHDLVIMPAILSVTSMLTEGALGSYMNSTEAKLKKKQIETVKDTLLVKLLRPYFRKIPQNMQQSNRFNISKENLDVFEANLKEKKNGLRIL